eukprot:8773669-Alexandrium_andersonii.AAC.1
MAPDVAPAAASAAAIASTPAANATRTAAVTTPPIAPTADVDGDIAMAESQPVPMDDAETQPAD